VRLPICDLGTGMWAVQGILAAFYERWHTGKGRLVECSLLETAIGFSSWTSAQWLADREEPTRQGSRHPQNAPYQRMQTKDGCLMVGAAGEAIWARRAKALGHPEWCEDPRFCDQPCAARFTIIADFADPQVRHRGLVQYVSDPELGGVSHIRTPSRSARVCGCAPSLPSSASTTPKTSAAGETEAEIKELGAKGIL
jgi:crotonobetainyl-CoA:carnitine CoA-transferase CaiB-like acyl-CoA transferase